MVKKISFLNVLYSSEIISNVITADNKKYALFVYRLNTHLRSIYGPFMVYFEVNWFISCSLNLI